MKMLSMKRPRPSIEIATPVARELAGESLGGECGALIGIENPRRSEPKERFLQRRCAEARIVGVRQPPRQEPLGWPSR